MNYDHPRWCGEMCMREGDCKAGCLSWRERCMGLEKRLDQIEADLKKFKTFSKKVIDDVNLI